MTEMLLVIQVIICWFALQAKDLLNAVIFLSVFSLLNALFFFYLHAPDVALTEAAVGAGISTFIFVWIIYKTDRHDDV